ncbi:Transcriptional regulator, LacI family [Pseudonocardia sp. Ae168_Ps1]|uniref:LacI family DNA-binding transcriptional regulator n=1 Tax=unclassified Pseudonocardia TaxID=2619320 RepID=UPI00094B6863|nr:MULTISPECIES: LacI family DNA-binding transcriptional regulator [unclassified Pseudonocardia]OLL72024.1 Transcriptional regulator, LacI family [Pseudonocardia sp. Ae150A_Ps1]OLL77990.1 Transcriptional regulator, LacI family [Pseudonocardia sp. Ae168_Ps1]OLL87886.1 Transcriptional regulator, LacI family [Pseudonocardia sp. Ae263_Ps1]OLL92089.1 Transcriptional regulator, LacI family [Pseudonocardia sp. Ae356_Ps1]
MGTRPTIYDVAAAAGVAPSTVSRALARPGQVSTRTAEKVRRSAEELGYRRLAVNAPTDSAPTGVLLLVTSDISNPFVFELVHGAEDAAFDAGLAIAVADSHESGPQERALVERALPRVDAVVLASSRLSDSAIRVLAKQKPTVVLNRAVRDVASVSTDYGPAARATITHLRELGHDAAEYLGGPAASWADGARWRALLEASRAAGVTLHRSGPAAPTVEGGIRFAEGLSDRPPTAVITFNDQMTVGVGRGLAAASLSVPADVSVVGFDDTVLAGLVLPNLTTIATPLRTIGRTAVTTALSSIDGTAPEPLSVEMPARLVVRESTGPRRARMAV